MATGALIATGGDTWYTWTTDVSGTAVGTAGDWWPTWVISAGTGATTNVTGRAVFDGIWRGWAGVGMATVPLPDRGDEADPVLRIAAPAQPPPPPDWTVRSTRVAEANTRAEHLLAECLTPGQRRELRRHGRFTVESQHGRRYEIRRGRSGNVAEIDGHRRGRPVLATYCIHPLDYVPDADTMLAQKLLLESDEERFRRVANRTVIARAGGRR